MHVIMSQHHSGNDFCGFEMALFNFIHDIELLNANTTINLMSKTVVKPREKPQFIYVEFTFFI